MQTDFEIMTVTVQDQLPFSFISIGDFSNYSTLWGSKDTNNRGKNIKNLKKKNDNLLLLNNHEPTRTY